MFGDHSSADCIVLSCAKRPNNKTHQTHWQNFEHHQLLSSSLLFLSVRSSQAFTPSTPLRFQSDEFSGGAAAFVRMALALAAASPLCLGLNTALLSLQSSIQLGWKWRLYITGMAMAPTLQNLHSKDAFILMSCQPDDIGYTEDKTQHLKTK